MNKIVALQIFNSLHMRAPNYTVLCGPKYFCRPGVHWLAEGSFDGTHKERHLNTAREQGRSVLVFRTLIKVKDSFTVSSVTLARAAIGAWAPYHSSLNGPHPLLICTPGCALWARFLSLALHPSLLPLHRDKSRAWNAFLFALLQITHSTCQGKWEARRTFDSIMLHKHTENLICAGCWSEKDAPTLCILLTQLQLLISFYKSTTRVLFKRLVMYSSLKSQYTLLLYGVMGTL